MEEIKLPDGLRSIGDCTFYQTGLKKIQIPAKVKLGKKVFDYTQLKEIAFADGRKVVPAYMLTQYSPRGLRIILPNVEYIGENSFVNCTSLKCVLVSNATSYRPDSFPEWCKVAIV